ncbi:MAG: hypothetical protein J2P39_08625, partial [Candidatus Dormibacteraeota bacterium]|nr:hypothetical protein [Candidatus Dormibacteraeota bacterium]
MPAPAGGCRFGLLRRRLAAGRRCFGPWCSLLGALGRKRWLRWLGGARSLRTQLRFAGRAGLRRRLGLAGLRGGRG